MRINIDGAKAAPIFISSAASCFGLIFDRALKLAIRRYYPVGHTATNLHAEPNLVEGFVVWWIDLMVYVTSAFSLSVAAVIQQSGDDRVALTIVSTVFWASALVAALRHTPFEYQSEFRYLRGVLLRLGFKLPPPRTSPAFTLVALGNIVALTYAIGFAW